MKKKIYTRPVSVVLTEETFNSIKKITDPSDISISDYIREAIKEKLASENTSEKENRS